MCLGESPVNMALGGRQLKTFFRGPLAIIAVVLVLGACTAPPRGDPIALAEWEEVNDPLEPTNRFIFSINLGLSKFILDPVAVAYRDIVPPFLKNVFRNLLFNARLPLGFIHATLQGNGEQMDQTASRFLTNMLFFWTADIESDTPLDIEDAGQTFAVWTDPEASGGPYLMLPIFGPSNVRDAAGRVADFFLDPIGFATSLEIGVVRAAGRQVDERSRTIDQVRDLERNSLDFYAAVRSLYRQRRAQQIRNDQIEPSEPAPTIGTDFPSISEAPLE